MKVINLHEDEKNLIQLAVDHNRHAQRQIYNKFSPKMLSVCRQYIKDVQLAEDVMITAFMKVFTNLNKFEYKGSFEGWIRRIMINEAISFLRVNKKVDFLEEKGNTYNEISEPDFNTAESNLGIEVIQNLIDNLPDGYKMIFNLFAIEGFKHNEIAAMLEISEGTSKSQVSHARKMLQQQLESLNKYHNGTK